MNSRSLALYQDLLDDLSRYLPQSVLADFSAGRDVGSWPDITPKQVAALTLASTFYKKFIDDVSADADSAALGKFLDVNKRCGTWVCELRDSGDEILYGIFKQKLYEFFYPENGNPLIHSFDNIMRRGRCGPGASVGSIGGDHYTKMYSSGLTFTSSAIYRAYRSYVDQYPNEADAELIRQAHYGHENIVPGNRLSFVPKKRDISRVICVEPTLNMYAQLGLGSILEDRLRRSFGIDFHYQPFWNRELARVGSGSGQYFTIDLESASDSMSLRMLREVLPPNVFAWFNLLRSPQCTLPNGTQVQMNMISTMGNGFTFPLQTILFTCMVSAAYDLEGIDTLPSSVDSLGNFGVFGDDIVGLASCHSNVRRLLRILGFTVNAEKSFFEGTFRESCGGDYFSGHPVRGVYVKTLRTPQARAVVLNRLHHWSSVTGIFLPKTTRTLYQSIPKRFVPYWENDDAGIKVPFSLVDKMRRSRHTQSIKYRKWVNRVHRIKIDGWQSLHRKGRIYNSYGLYLSFLSGHIRSSSITLRQREVDYTTKAAVAPCWDPPRKVLVPDTSWQRWETAVWLTVKG